MKEAIFVLFVVFLLLGLTAIRYRKTIAGLIGMARMLKDAKDSVGQNSRSFPGEPAKSIPLVNCSKCGVWVPQNKARKMGDVFFCSEQCLTSVR